MGTELKMNSNSKLAILFIILVEQSQLQREDNFVRVAWERVVFPSV